MHLSLLLGSGPCDPRRPRVPRHSCISSCLVSAGDPGRPCLRCAVAIHLVFPSTEPQSRSSKGSWPSLGSPCSPELKAHLFLSGVNPLWTRVPLRTLMSSVECVCRTVRDGGVLPRGYLRGHGGTLLLLCALRTAVLHAPKLVYTHRGCGQGESPTPLPTGVRSGAGTLTPASSLASGVTTVPTSSGWQEGGQAGERGGVLHQNPTR